VNSLGMTAPKEIADEVVHNAGIKGCPPGH
jgi:hypothetical protein